MFSATPYMYKDQLESERLVTRYLTAEDYKAWATFFEDEEASEFLPKFNGGTHEAHAEFWINRQLSRYASNQFGLQALTDKKTKQFVGQCGLLLQEVEGRPELEVGYHIFKQYRGLAYAPEAAKIFIDFAFKNLPTQRIISIIQVNNIKSQRVAQKNGAAK